MENLDISIIITTKNSESFIGDCIKAIKGSWGIGEYFSYEIIVVDNYSKDGTQVIAQSYPKVRVVCHGPERSAQRNKGKNIARGKYILLLDTDMRVDTNLLLHCWYSCERLKLYDGMFIREQIVGSGFWIKVRDFERSFYDRTRIDAIRFGRADMWPDYNEDLTGAEDWLHDREFKGEKGFCNFPVYHNEGSFNVKKYVEKKTYYIQWMDEYRRILKDEHQQTDLPELSFWYRYLGVFIEDGKYKKVLKHPVLYISMLYLRFRVGLRYLLRNEKEQK